VLDDVLGKWVRRRCRVSDRDCGRRTRCRDDGSDDCSCAPHTRRLRLDACDNIVNVDNVFRRASDDDGDMLLHIWLDDLNPPRGHVRATIGPKGLNEPFSGWLGLLGALERLTSSARASGDQREQLQT
jgi:hypothetical protein